MSQRTSSTARGLAVSALIVGFLVLLVAIATSLGGGSRGGSAAHSHRGHVSTRLSKGLQRTPATYVVKNGDTLIAIAHKTGIPVAEIERLNPEVDPQILVSGERLKLR